MIYICGEHIKAGHTVVCGFADGKVYTAGAVAGVLVGNAIEELREGFRVYVRDGEVREDDA